MRVLERMTKMPGGVYGILALPFLTLAMEKSIYDTVQCWQGIDPNVRPKDRGGFPSGGASKCSTFKVILFYFISLDYLHDHYVSVKKIYLR